MIDRNRTKPVSLYLHFPFCERKCRYCDFLSGPASDEARENYMQLLCREIVLRREEVKGPVDTIFIGGGTPSLMTPSQLSRLMETIYDTFQISADESDPEINIEISMEINPGTADREKLSAYRRTGVNRLSIGVQTFSDAELQMLGRIHSAYQARKIFGEARKAGFDNINLDLMSALPGQKVSDWEKTLLQTVSPKLTVITGKVSRVKDCQKQMEQNNVAWKVTSWGNIVMETDGKDWYVNQEDKFGELKKWQKQQERKQKKKKK